jgi:hypothetical protein
MVQMINDSFPYTVRIPSQQKIPLSTASHREYILRKLFEYNNDIFMRSVSRLNK